MPTNSTSPPALRVFIQQRALAEIRADGRNARNHAKRQIAQIARSITTFGFLVPIIVDADGQVICGHGRLLAAEQLGMTEAPVIEAAHLSPSEVRAFQLTDNKLTDNSDWNPALLREALLELQVLDFDLSLTGFEAPEIDLALTVGEAACDDDGEVPSKGPLITRPGDVWEALDHRVTCGDALSASSLRALMPDERARAIVADVPYNVRVQGNAAGFGKVKYAEFREASGEKTEAEFTAFLMSAFQRIAEVALDGASAYVFIDWRHIYEVTVAGRHAFAGQRNLCVWDKGVGGQGSFYRSQHELVTVWLVRAGKPVNNIHLGRYGRTRTNVWPYASPSRLGHAGEEGRLTLDHPTPKPVALVADAILDCSHRGDIVLDPFLGGGATLIAAERTGRRCRGIDIEPQFVDAAIRRFRRLTGEDARRVSDGRLFSELEAEASDER